MSDSSPFETAEEAAEFYAQAFRKFIFLRGDIDPFPNEIVDPSAFRLQRPRNSFLEDNHALTAELFAQQAANEANELLKMLLGLKSWQSILPDYEATQRYYLEVEFVGPLLREAVAAVGAIKNQVAYSVAKVAIQLESFESTSDIPRDRNITASTWERWARGWTGAPSFRARLLDVNSKEFVVGTRELRNRRAHRIPPSPFGVIPAHIVRREGKQWLMEIRYEERLDTAQVIDLLVQQHAAVERLIGEMRSFLRHRFDGIIETERRSEE